MSQPRIFANVFMKSPVVAHAVSKAGFDGAVIDLQHGEVTLQDCWALIEHFKNKDIEVWARVPDFDRGVVGRLLDFGVEKIIQPMVDSEATAQNLVSACTFAPAGTRSFGPLRIDSLPQDYIHQSSVHQAIAQVESALAMDRLESIAAIDGLFGIYVGPADLALSLGQTLPPKFSEEPLSSAFTELRAQTEKNGIDFIIHVGDPGQVSAALSFSPNVVILQSDFDLMRNAMEKSVTSFKEML
ncbi:HpcH/HpaI aldolase family protein [Corynebacterium glutamicum]|uniref:HpcH/HpaI aldolase family protein n=1 Tax=Corynebacterium glutamicum TaxID=1718 RepID=UPI0007720024|nr:aldolase/citrate lyase family protein [Corynebacterium glutamicum]AMK79437.1 hypothetical protein APT58_15180 [Corynebacterium glutamicum]